MIDPLSLAVRLLREIERCHCGDCGTLTLGGNYYMVQDGLWKRYGNGEGMLCISCLEKRVGRRLTNNDFTMRPW